MAPADRLSRTTRVLVWILLATAGLNAIAAIATYQFAAKYFGQYGNDASGFVYLLGLVVQVGFGALIALRRPRHPVGWLLLVPATLSLVDIGAVQNYIIYAIHVRHRALPGADLIGSFDQMMWILGVAPSAIFLPLVFPTGRLLSRRWRLVVWVAVTGMIVAFFGGALNGETDPTPLIAGVRPVVLPGPIPAIAAVMTFALALLPVCVLAGVVSLFLRYRRGSADERHQIKWLLFAVALYLVGFASNLALAAAGYQVMWLQDVGVLGLALIPVAAALAVLKYRLYDIDVVISRALVYGALAALISSVYVGMVVGIGTLIGQGGHPNLFLSVLATGVVAVGFQPVRERLQKVANRMVYGKRATPYEVLSQFSEHVAESYAAEHVLQRMARVLADGTGADTVAVWLRTGAELRPAAVYPEGANGHAPLRVTGQMLPDVAQADRVVPVRHQGELLGALTVNKRRGEALTPIEEKLLGDLAHQAGLVLKNVGLTADLKARVEELHESRKRLVAAQDQERRRLERNLHDGAQQHLVALKVNLGIAEMTAAKDPVKAKEMIRQLQSAADETLETLRDLARGIYPPLLADKGLGAALEAHTRKATIPVSVEADGVGRYPQEMEAAVYFCCLEALQNVQKYANASAATVRVREKDGQLRFEVEDDGIGFDPETTKRGAGLGNMADRLDALGGSFTVESQPGTGTRLVGAVGVTVILDIGRRGSS